VTVTHTNLAYKTTLAARSDLLCSQS
jgi:hypothetical protein